MERSEEPCSMIYLIHSPFPSPQNSCCNQVLFSLPSMASSSSSHQLNQEFDAFSGKRRVVCESSRLFDVFINHRGPDVKQTLAIQLYDSLHHLGIRAFLDSQEKELGDSFPSTIETAISSASVHVAIFSKRYAESAWCLTELVLMLQSQAKIIPVFYGVNPGDLRHIETGAYAEAFTKYKEKGRYLEKLNEWKEALQSLSLIAGEEFNSDWHCQNIVAAVQKEVQRKTRLHVAQYPVGLNNLVKDFEKRCLQDLVQDFENQCGLKKTMNKVKVVGIFGIGGSGKTTLAKELFNRKRSSYSRASFLFDAREMSQRRELPSLQLKLLNDLFHSHHLNFTSMEEGTTYLKDSLERIPNHLSFLIVVDDIDNVEQLDALLIMDIVNKLGNSLVIVTTRDTGVLIRAGITDGYCLKGMDRIYGSELLCWHAFDQPKPFNGYENLVNSFVDVCGGLPLSLQVLGRHVHGRNEDYWRSELIEVRKTLPQDVKRRLRISFDALTAEEKQIFMDIACFFGGRRQNIAEEVWEASGWNAQHALQTLRDKCLVEEENECIVEEINDFSFFQSNDGCLVQENNIYLRMHDHLRDLGREMALEFSPPHRLWRPQDLQYLESRGFINILSTANVRCFHSTFDQSIKSRVAFFLGQSDICVETSASLLWLELVENKSISSLIPLQSLQCLKIKYARLKTLWKNRIQAPSQLKCLDITDCKHLRSVSAISNIQKLVELTINGCPELKELTLDHLSCLEKVTIKKCKHLKGVSGMSNLRKLIKLEIFGCWKLKFECLCLSGAKCLESIAIDKSVAVKCFMLDGCQILITIKFGCRELVQFSIRGCPELEEFPEFRFLSRLERIIVDGCRKLNYLPVFGCPKLISVTGSLEFRRLYICQCPELEELPNLSSLNCLEKIEIYSCEKLQSITLSTTLISLSTRGCRDLQRVAAAGDLTKLTNLYIRDCPELEELPSLSTSNCLEKIEVYSCERLQRITLPTALISLFIRSCRSLQRIETTGDLTKLTRLFIRDCPELEELPSLSSLNCLEKIKIDCCEKLQNNYAAD